MTESAIGPTAAGRAWIGARLARLSPLAGVLTYPYVLQQSHTWSVAAPASPTAAIGAALALAIAFLVPLYGLAVASRLGRIEHPSEFHLRARRLAFACVAAPPLFVFAGVGLGILRRLGAPDWLPSDTTLWVAAWAAAAISGLTGSDRQARARPAEVGRVRVLHGAVAAALSAYVLFHLGNHLLALIGPQAHERAMAIGRTVYRSFVGEPILISLFIVQVALGLRLAAAWTARPSDPFRSVQLGSGVYVGAYVLTHMNSALVSARALRGTTTDWSWASGALEGLIEDAWNIRLLPHYALGAFLLLVHLCSGLRVVMIAHGVDEARANAFWSAGVAASALVAAAITAALCGVRL